MRKLFAFYTVMILASMAMVSFAWLGGGEEYQEIIIGVNTAYLTTTNTSAPFGTEFEDGFEVGYPVTFQLYVVPYDPTYAAASNYHEISLEYHIGTNTLSSTNWQTIGTITQDFNSYTGKVSTFSFQEWDPPTKGTNYLVRFYAKQLAPQSGENLDKTETNIDSEGGLTHDDEEVLMIFVRDDQRPGTGE